MTVARTLHIQVQPGLAESLDTVRLRREFQTIAAGNPLVTEYRFRNGSDEGEFFNFDFDTPRPADLWAQIRGAVYDDSPFGQSVRGSSLALCTGHHGWDDYLLIHHWDSDEDLEVPVI